MPLCAMPCCCQPLTSDTGTKLRTSSFCRRRSPSCFSPSTSCESAWRTSRQDGGHEVQGVAPSATKPLGEPRVCRGRRSVSVSFPVAALSLPRTLSVRLSLPPSLPRSLSLSLSLSLLLSFLVLSFSLSVFLSFILSFVLSSFLSFFSLSLSLRLFLSLALFLRLCLLVGLCRCVGSFVKFACSTRRSSAVRSCR